MSETEFFEMLAKLRDSYNDIHKALDNFIQQKSKVVLKEYDPEKIAWVEAEGPRGKYQKTDDVNNSEYKALRKDLAEHKEFLRLKGFQYWTFQNGSTIGRKPQCSKRP